MRKRQKNRNNSDKAKQFLHTPDHYQETKPPAELPQFEPANEEQQRAYEACASNHITFLTGPAGCGKTWVATCLAVDEILRERADKMVMIRPTVEACGEHLGFMPGSIHGKMAPYLRPLKDAIKEYGDGHADRLKQAQDWLPLAFARGLTLKRSIVVLDEAQNATEAQIQMLLTRIGRGSRIILCGDPDQTDLYQCDLAGIAEDLTSIRGITWIKLTQDVRHPIISKVNGVFDARRQRRSAMKTG